MQTWNPRHAFTHDRSDVRATAATGDCPGADRLQQPTDLTHDGERLVRSAESEALWIEDASV